jgi:adenylate cyclase, class 2
MNTTGQELEVKFYIPDLPAFEKRLEDQGAALELPRVHEVNLRFDTPTETLSRAYQVLRLRQDTLARVTFKGPGIEKDGVRQRQELEFSVSDFAAAQAVFEALGYQVALLYEKYRTTYLLGGVLVVLDEMPYGNFIEIEGPDGESIQKAARQLGVDWEKRILDSYVLMFERLRQAKGWTFRDLSFDNFAGKIVSPEDLGVQRAG